MGKFDENSKLKDVMADEQGMAVLTKYLGDKINNPMVALMKNQTMGNLKNKLPSPEMQSQFGSVMEELEKLD